MITIRPLEPRDRAVLRFGFAQLSPASRYGRYHSIKPELTNGDLGRLLRVDHWHHEALVGWSLHPRRPVGFARYVRAADFDAAELAVEVVDAWQRRGVGGALITELVERAHAAGIRRFRAVVLRENRGALALVRSVRARGCDIELDLRA